MKLHEAVPLAPLSTLGVGGPARFFVDAVDEASVRAALDWATRHGVSVRVLGGGSNVVVSDAGFDGLVVRVGLRGRQVTTVGRVVELEALAGEPWDELVAWTVEQGLAGFECLSGIPGFVGATPIQNVGAYGQEVAETLSSVRTLDRKTGEIADFSAEECRFSYRDSFLKSGEPERFVVLGVRFRLACGAAPKIAYPELSRHLAGRGIEKPSLADVRTSVLEVRAAKSMLIASDDVNRRSCGSFFMNPLVPPERVNAIEIHAGAGPMPSWPQSDGRVKLSAGWLIERAGFTRGERLGAAGISTRHSLALVCHDGARASDVVGLARRIRQGVESRLGVRLFPEPAFWGFASLDDGLPDEQRA